MIATKIKSEDVAKCLAESKRRQDWFQSQQRNANPIRLFVDCAAEMAVAMQFQIHIRGFNHDTGRSDGVGVMRVRGTISGILFLAEEDLVDKAAPFVCVAFEEKDVDRSMENEESLPGCVLGWRFGFECVPGQQYGRSELYHTDSLKNYLNHEQREIDAIKRRKIELDKKRLGVTV